MGEHQEKETNAPGIHAWVQKQSWLL